MFHPAAVDQSLFNPKVYVSVIGAFLDAQRVGKGLAVGDTYITCALFQRICYYYTVVLRPVANCTLSSPSKTEFTLGSLVTCK